jgi:hypothetical protein
MGGTSQIIEEGEVRCRQCVGLVPLVVAHTRRIMEVVEMPNRVAENLVIFIRQDNGTLSKRRRDGEFKKLGDEEVALIEGIVSDEFAGF